MSQETIARPLVALEIGAEHVEAILASDELARRVDESGIVFLQSSFIPAPTRLDPTIAFAFLSRNLRKTGFVINASPQRDHPFNLARRVASLDHLTGGRAGLALFPYDPVLGREHRAGGDASNGLSLGAPLDEDGLRDTADLLVKLWQSWPLSSVIADRDSGVFTRLEEIRAVDHHGVFDVAGPLNIPSTPQGVPVLVLGSVEEGGLEILGGTTPRVFRRVSLAVFSSTAALTAPDGDAGIVVSLPGNINDQSGTAERLLDALSLIDSRISEGHYAAANNDVTLRTRLGLGEPVDALQNARSAYPPDTVPTVPVVGTQEGNRS